MSETRRSGIRVTVYWVAIANYDARIRLQAENERLRSEIHLLREEVRIKDARMETIPPHRRPHYPPVDGSPFFSCTPLAAGRRLRLLRAFS